MFIVLFHIDMPLLPILSVFWLNIKHILGCKINVSISNKTFLFTDRYFAWIHHYFTRLYIPHCRHRLLFPINILPPIPFCTLDMYKYWLHWSLWRRDGLLCTILYNLYYHYSSGGHLLCLIVTYPNRKTHSISARCKIRTENSKNVKNYVAYDKRFCMISHIDNFILKHINRNCHTLHAVIIMAKTFIWWWEWATIV